MIKAIQAIDSAWIPPVPGSSLSHRGSSFSWSPHFKKHLLLHEGKSIPLLTSHPLSLLLISGVMEVICLFFYMTDLGEFKYIYPQECRTPCFPPNINNHKQCTECAMITSLRVCRVLLSSDRLLIK